MALKLTYWKRVHPDRPEDMDQVMERRINKVEDIPEKMRPMPRDVDVVALERTDGQSNRFKIVWERAVRGQLPRYKFNRKVTDEKTTKNPDDRGNEK